MTVSRAQSRLQVLFIVLFHGWLVTNQFFSVLQHKHGRQCNTTNTDSKRTNKQYTKISISNSLQVSTVPDSVYVLGYLYSSLFTM